MSYTKTIDIYIIIQICSLFNMKQIITLSGTLVFAPAIISRRITSTLLSSTAVCRGVSPS